MNKLIEFAKNNTMIVAGVAAVVLFIAMNSLTSCVAHGNGDSGQQQEQAVSSNKSSGEKSSDVKKVILTDAQKAAIGNYTDAVKGDIETLEKTKWAGTDGKGSLTVKNNVLTEKYSENDNSKNKVKTVANTFAITASDTLDVDQTGAMSYKIYTLLDGSGKEHILKFATVNPAANGEGGDIYYELTCDLFKNENGYANNRNAENAKIDGLDDPNLSKAIDGRTKELKKSLIDYLVVNHATATELVWNGTVSYMYSANSRTFMFTVKDDTNTDDSNATRINVTYHADTHEFEEADVQ